jgi:hypothetical protein
MQYYADLLRIFQIPIINSRCIWPLTFDYFFSGINSTWGGHRRVDLGLQLGVRRHIRSGQLPNEEKFFSFANKLFNFCARNQTFKICIKASCVVLYSQFYHKFGYLTINQLNMIFVTKTINIFKFVIFVFH